MQHDQKPISEAYRAHRPHLVDLAFRMLGDIGAAEDVVQDAFSRLMGAEVGEIEDYRGRLIVVTSRLCLDRIRSARARRERAHDAAEIEFIAPQPRARRPGGPDSSPRSCPGWRSASRFSGAPAGRCHDPAARPVLTGASATRGRPGRTDSFPVPGTQERTCST
jgi:hypothetical protein